ncbi:MAG: hypothetical protein KI791_22730 [Cyclobacteriaceae bacterium]|nr:hypothetical protein [Cyclobacteriaceae bacterium SS2]
MRTFTFIYLLSITYWASGQSQNIIGSAQQQNGRTGFFGTLMNTKETSNSIDGNPYFNETWKPGMLYLENDVEINVDLLNYNVFENSLTYKERNKEYLISTYTDLKKFEIGDDVFVYLYSNHSKDIYQLLSDGPIRLLKRYYCKILMGMESKGIIGATNDKYMKNDDLYVQKEGLQPDEFKTRKRDLYKLMDDKREEIKYYIDDKGLNINKEDDLIQVFNYYNELISI